MAKELIPEILVALSFYPCGAFLAFVLHSYNTLTEYYYDDYYYRIDVSFHMGLVYAILGAAVTGLLLGISKHVAKRIVWIHYYLLALGSASILAGGVTLINTRPSWYFDYYSSSALAGLGHGIIYISGITYVSLRNNNYKRRAATFGLCHLSMAIGLVSSTAYMSFYFQKSYPSYNYFGYCLVYSCGSILVCFVINELLHAFGVYNYKMALDPELQEADQKKDRLQTALTNHSAVARPKRQWVLTKGAVAGKLMNGVLYNMSFLIVTLVNQRTFLNGRPMWDTVPFWCLLGGIIIGIIVAVNSRVKIIYSVLLFVKGAILTAAILTFGGRYYTTSAVMFWAYYVVGGASVFIPDMAIAEVSNPKFLEWNMLLGFTLEQIPIILSIREFSWTAYLYGTVSRFGMGFGIAALVVLVIFWYLYPNTFHLRPLEIQRLVLYNDKRKWMPANVPGNSTIIHQYLPTTVHPPTMVMYPPTITFPPPPTTLPPPPPPPQNFGPGYQVYSVHPGAHPAYGYPQQQPPHNPYYGQPTMMVPVSFEDTPGPSHSYPYTSADGKAAEVFATAPAVSSQAAGSDMPPPSYDNAMKHQ